MLEVSLFVIVSNVKEGFSVLKKLLFRERIVKVLIFSIKWIYMDDYIERNRSNVI